MTHLKISTGYVSYETFLSYHTHIVVERWANQDFIICPMMVRLEMVLEMLVYLLFNHLMQLLPKESSIEFSCHERYRFYTGSMW